MNQTKPSALSDKVGITSAVLCTIHCLAMPILFLLKGWYASNFMPDQLPYWWHSIDYIFLVISFIAVYHSAGHTKTKEIKMSLWIFWLILTVGILFTSTLHWMVYIASAGLITTHFINIRRMSRALYTR